MREWCSCGAAIRGTRKDVQKWRKEHLHEGKQESHRESDTYSHTTISNPYLSPSEVKRIGFRVDHDEHP